MAEYTSIMGDPDLCLQTSQYLDRIDLLPPQSRCLLYDDQDLARRADLQPDFRSILAFSFPITGLSRASNGIVRHFRFARDCKTSYKEQPVPEHFSQLLGMSNGDRKMGILF